MGDGFEPLRQLVECVEARGDPSSIDGVACRAQGRAAPPPPAASPIDLDGLPFHELGFDVAKQPGAVREIYLSTSTGCQFDCSFCSANTIWGGRRLAMSAKGVLERIEHYCARYGTHRVHFCDDTFNSSRKRVEELCQGMIERRLHLGFSCAARVAPFDPPMAALLRQAGCERVELGVESASARVRRLMGKGTSDEQIAAAFDAARSAGIRTLAFLMFAHPGESLLGALGTYRLLRRIRPDFVHSSVCARLPGTQIEAEYKSLGRFRDEDWLDRHPSRRDRLRMSRPYGFPRAHLLAGTGLAAVKLYQLAHLKLARDFDGLDP